MGYCFDFSVFIVPSMGLIGRESPKIVLHGDCGLFGVVGGCRLGGGLLMVKCFGCWGWGIRDAKFLAGFPPFQSISALRDHTFKGRGVLWGVISVF